MARYDKYDPKSGGFRAPLAANRAASTDPFGVGLDVNGRVVHGAGTTGVRGVLIEISAKLAGDPVDVMTDGEIVEFAGAAGTSYTALTTTGVISSAAADATHINVGFTVEATRLIVRVHRA